MTKPISRKQHGFTDYSYVPLVAVAPEMAGFTKEKKASALCRILSGSILASSLFTKAEWGAVRVLPFKTHCVLDIAVGIFSLSAPWLFGFSKNKAARNTFLLMGVTGILAGSLSDQSDEMDDEGLKNRRSYEKKFY